jgi:hypothetical protein
VASIILKPYESRQDPGPVRRFLMGALLVFVAMVYGALAAVLPPQLMAFPATPIFIMIGVVLWMLPDVGGVYYDKLQAVMIPYLAIGIAWPGYVAFNLPGLPWISLTRGALALVLFTFVWNFSTSREMRDRLRDSVSETPLAIRIFWLFWATTTFSLVFSNQPSLSINKYINNQIYWTMALLVTSMLATRPGFVTKMSKTLVIATGIVFIYALYEYHLQRVPWIDYLPSFLKIDPDLLEILKRSQARAGTDVYRVRGPYPASLYFSEFLTMAFPFFLHFTVKERRALPFMALAAGTFGCMTVMVLTNARSAMVGMIVAALLYTFYSASRRRTQDSRSIMGTGVLLAYPAMLLVVALVVEFWHRAHVMVLGGGQHQASSDARNVQWAMAWPRLASHPFGYGVNRGGDALGYVNLAGEGTVDSYFISVMMDSGYIALPLFLLTFLVPAWLAFRYHRTAVTFEEQLLAPLSIALINFCIVKSVLSSEASVPLAFVFVGCIIGLVWQRKRGVSTEPAVIVPGAGAAVAPPPRHWAGQPALASASDLPALPEFVRP